MCGNRYVLGPQEGGVLMSNKKSVLGGLVKCQSKTKNPIRSSPAFRERLEQSPHHARFLLIRRGAETERWDGRDRDGFRHRSRRCQRRRSRSLPSVRHRVDTQIWIERGERDERGERRMRIEADRDFDRGLRDDGHGLQRRQSCQRLGCSLLRHRRRRRGRGRGRRSRGHRRCRRCRRRCSSHSSGRLNTLVLLLTRFRFRNDDGLLPSKSPEAATQI